MFSAASAAPSPHVTTAYSGCRWDEVPTQTDQFSVPMAMREVMATREVRHGFPAIAAVIQFLAAGVSQAVLTTPKSARLIYLMRRIIDSLVSVGYAAIYLDRTTHQLDVVSPWLYLAVTPSEYETITGIKPPAVGKTRAGLSELVESHVAYFPNENQADKHFHSKFGTPIVFVGDWHPDHGVPTTPCHAAYNSFETRKNIVTAAKVTAARSMQPATGFVMTQPIGGVASALNSINSVTGAIGPTEVLTAYGQQVTNIRERQRAELEQTLDELRMHAVEGDLADQLSAVVARGGDGHMAWVPPPVISSLDVGNQIDMMVGEVAIGYQIPPDALNLKSALEKTAHTSLREAHKTFLTISSMANQVQTIIDLSCEVAAGSTGKDSLRLPEGRLEQVVPPEILMEMNDIFAPEGRKRMFSQAIRVTPDFIDPLHLKEREWDRMIEATQIRADQALEAAQIKSAEAERAAKRQKVK